jgi:hypothetical protein
MGNFSNSSGAFFAVSLIVAMMEAGETENSLVVPLD